MKKFLLLSLLILASSCSICKKCPVQTTEHTDSVRIEIRERLVTIHDSVLVSVPVVKERNVTKDSSSHIENEWLVSDAMIKDGKLYHSAETKPHEQYIPYEAEIPAIDSTYLEYKGEKTTVIKEVERDLTFWQKAWIAMGKIFAFVLIISILYLAIRVRD